jgi:hypothetical protein
VGQRILPSEVSSKGSGGTRAGPIRLHRVDPENKKVTSVALGFFGEKETSTSEGGRINAVMPADNAKTHWENVYTTKAPDQVSWYRPHLEMSLSLIERAAAGVSASIIDVGGGESTLVDDLLVRG